MPRDPGRPDAASGPRPADVAQRAPLRPPGRRPAHRAGRAGAAATRLRRLPGPRLRLPPRARDAGGQPRRRAGPGGGNPAEPPPAVAHRPAAARPGHSRTSRPCPTTCGGRAVAARRGWPAAACSCSGRAPGRPARTFSDDERELARRVVPPTRRRPRRPRGCRRPRSAAIPRPSRPRSVESAPRAACPTPRWCSASPTRCSPTTPTSRRLPAHRPPSAAPASDARAATSARRAASATTRPRPSCRVLCAGPSTSSTAPSRQSSTRRTPTDARRLPSVRSTWRSHIPTTCRAGGWSSASAASTSTPDRSGLGEPVVDRQVGALDAAHHAAWPQRPSRWACSRSRPGPARASSSAVGSSSTRSQAARSPARSRQTAPGSRSARSCSSPGSRRPRRGRERRQTTGRPVPGSPGARWCSRRPARRSRAAPSRRPGRSAPRARARRPRAGPPGPAHQWSRPGPASGGRTPTTAPRAGRPTTAASAGRRRRASGAAVPPRDSREPRPRAAGRRSPGGVG